MTIAEAKENIMMQLYIGRKDGKVCRNVDKLQEQLAIPPDSMHDALSLLAQEGMTKSISNVDVTIAMPGGVDWVEEHTPLAATRHHAKKEREAVLRAVADAQDDGVRPVPQDELIRRTNIEQTTLQFHIDYLFARGLIDERLGGAVLTLPEGRAYLQD